MNPAVGITKILNNIQECLDIIKEIDKRNEIVLPNLNYINELSDAKKKLIDILRDGKLDEIEKISRLAKESKDIIQGYDHLVSYIDHFIPYHKKIISEFDNSLDNSIGRIKNLRGESRIAWFNGWETNDWQYDAFKSVVTGYCNWEYPVMEIFPGKGNMLQHALSGEPLYIVDWDEDLLDSVANQFNSYYATKRLMRYKIEEYDLSALPQNSFGFIYSINWLVFEQQPGLIELAKSVYNCLMPGGVYLFYYNNSDDWWSVMNYSHYYFGLVDTKDLNKALQDVGFEIVDNVRSKEMNTSYFICKKPGEINYIKNSSVLGKIIDKPQDLK